MLVVELANTKYGWTLPETGESHGQSGGTSTVLGLDNLITTELNACRERSIAAIRQTEEVVV